MTDQLNHSRLRQIATIGALLWSANKPLVIEALKWAAQEISNDEPEPPVIGCGG